MARVEIPVEAKLNAADLDAELKQLTQKINTLGQSIAQANKVKFNPIGKATLDDLKRVQTEFEKMKRTSQLGTDINRTGQDGKSFSILIGQLSPATPLPARHAAMARLAKSWPALAHSLRRTRLHPANVHPRHRQVAARHGLVQAARSLVLA